MRNASRAAAGAAAWQMMDEANGPGKPSVWARARAVPRMLRTRLRGEYPQLTKARLLMILLAAAYIVSPIDLVPELFIPILGLADDAAVAVWLTSSLLGETERFLRWEMRYKSPVQGQFVD